MWRSWVHRLTSGLLAVSLLLVIGQGARAQQKEDIVLWITGPLYQSVFATLIPMFEEKYPNVNLIVESGMGGVDRLVTAYAGGAAPDITLQSTRNAPQYIEAGMVHPVDYRIFGAGDMQSFAERFFPGVVNSLAYKGEIYFLPTEVSSGGLYYNKDILDAAGVGEIPETWQALRVLSSRLTRREGDTPTQIGMALNRGAVWNTLYWISMIRQTGIDWIGENGEPNFADQRAVEAIQAYHDFYLHGASFGDQRAPAFREGRAAFHPDATYQNFFMVANPPDFTPGAAPFPVLEGGTPSNFSYGWGLYVTTQAKNPSLAWEVVRFFTSAEVAPIWLNQGGLLIPYQEEWLFEAIQEQPMLRTFVTGLEHAEMELVHARGADIRAAIGEADVAIVNGEMPVESALQRLNARVSAILKED